MIIEPIYERVDRIMRKYMCICGDGVASAKCPCGAEMCVNCAPDHVCRHPFEDLPEVFRV